MTLTPNGDGQGDAADVGFTLSADANVGADVVDSTGAVVAQAAPLRWRRAGERTIAVVGQSLADGSYTLRLTAKATGGRVATVDVPLLVTRTLGRVALDAASFTPNGDGRGDTLTITVPLAAPASSPFGSSVTGSGSRPRSQGRSTRGRRPRPGMGRSASAARATVRTSSRSSPSTRTGPRVSSYPWCWIARHRSFAIVSTSPAVLHVSEPAVLAVRANGALRRIAVAAAARRSATRDRVAQDTGRRRARRGREPRRPAPPLSASRPE